jgi:two-component system OmpR family sensor kinase
VRRRIVLATCGAVFAALLLAGLGTLALARADARRATQEDLARQAEGLAQLFEGIGSPPETRAGQLQTAAVRTRLSRLARTLELDDIAFLVSGPRLDYQGELPAGVALGPDDEDALRDGQVVSGANGDTVFAAAPGTFTRTDASGAVTTLGAFVVVLTSDPSSVAAPAGRWFVLASIATLALAALVAVSLSRRLARPVTDARDAARRIAGGDLAARVPAPAANATDELADLSRSINTMAEALERSRGLERQFLMSVSHDLRTPMASIQGYAEALTDGAIEPDRAAAVILAESRRLDRLVTDLLLLARLDARSFTLELGPVDTAAVVNATARAFAPRAAERGIEIVVQPVTGSDGAPGPLVSIADGDRLAQVVANLVENALKFAHAQVDVRVVPDDGWIVVSVADDGPGIDAVDLPHVFERLYVAKHRPVAAESGSGLGLAIVRELAEAMGGHVSARSPVPPHPSGAEIALALRPA